MKTISTILFLSLLLSALPIFANELSSAIQDNDLKTVTRLLTKDKTLVNSPTDDGLPIFLSIYSGNIDMLSACLNAGANIESREYWGNTPLMTASSNGQPDMVKLLLDKGANVNARNRDGETALKVSVHNDATITTMLLEKGANLALGDNNGVTPLMESMRIAALEQLELLLLKGADFNNIDKRGNSMLNYAAMTQNFAMVMIALDKGCDAKLANENGDTPLQSLFGFGNGEYAVDEGMSTFDPEMTPEEIAEWKLNMATIHFDSLSEKLQDAARKELGGEITDDMTAICTLLLNRDANVNAIDDQGNSPIMGATYLGDSGLVKFLLAKGADSHVVNEAGVNLAQAAANSGNLALLQFYDDQGLSLKNVADNGFTLLHNAVHSANSAMISYLLDKGLDINARENNGQSPQFLVFDKYDMEVAEKNINLLVAKGAKINLQDASGITLLETAVYQDNEQLVKALLDNGADVNLKNYDGQSPLDIATNNNAENVLPLLKKAAEIK